VARGHPRHRTRGTGLPAGGVTTGRRPSSPRRPPIGPQPHRSMAPLATRSVIRSLWAGTRDRVRDHLLRLDAEDRMLRFGGYVSAAQIAAYCEQLDWGRVVVVGYITGGEVRGVSSS